MFTYKGEIYDISKTISGNLVLMSQDEEFGFWEPNCYITKEIDGDRAMLDAPIGPNGEFNGRFLLEVIKLTKIAKPVKPQQWVDSGFNSYPVFILDWDRINYLLRGGEI